MVPEKQIEILNIGNGIYLVGGINFGGDIGICRVEIHKADLDKPRMRIISLDKNFKTAIGIFENKIYPYGDEESDTLSPEQCEIFNAWVCIEDGYGYNIWYNISNLLGEITNHTFEYPANLVQPDYRVLT